MSTDEHHRHSRAELLRRAAGAVVGIAGLQAGLGRVLAGGLAHAASDAQPELASRDEPLGAARGLLSATLAPRPAPRFDLLGLHWQGPGAVSFRTRSRDGAWSGWQRAVTHELPDPGSEGLSGWQLGTPVWTGPADAVQYRLEGRIERLRAHFVRSEPRQVRRPASATQPFIVLRASWGADESIVKGNSRYADRLSLAIVHHTAGTSPATPEESAAVVRAIQTYHVKSNGWNDIGYNFLVDPFGQVFEGRAGGVERNVIGAHALGFNTGTVGVALLGNFEKKVATPEAHAALAAFLAWRLDVGHVDPVSTVSYVSDGQPHELRAVSGHRDVNATACPGANLYPELDGLAGESGALGLPKLYEPSAEVTSKTSVSFRGRLSEPLPWTVTVTDAKGAQIASGSGIGPVIDWTWQTAKVSTGDYRYAIEAGADVRPATGWLSLEGPAPPDPEPPPRPPRPDGIPRRIPRWAWKLRLWHLTPKGQRGPRPKSPRPLPAWYWRWFNWWLELERWKDQYGEGAAG